MPTDPFPEANFTMPSVEHTPPERTTIERAYALTWGALLSIANGYKETLQEVRAFAYESWKRAADIEEAAAHIAPSAGGGSEQRQLAIETFITTVAGPSFTREEIRKEAEAILAGRWPYTNAAPQAETVPAANPPAAAVAAPVAWSPIERITQHREETQCKK